MFEQRLVFFRWKMSFNVRYYFCRHGLDWLDWSHLSSHGLSCVKYCSYSIQWCCWRHLHYSTPVKIAKKIAVVYELLRTVTEIGHLYLQMKPHFTGWMLSSGNRQSSILDLRIWPCDLATISWLLNIIRIIAFNVCAWLHTSAFLKTESDTDPVLKSDSSNKTKIDKEKGGKGDLCK